MMRTRNLLIIGAVVLMGSTKMAAGAFINGAAPEKMLDQELHDGDSIEFVYGFCGG